MATEIPVWNDGEVVGFISLNPADLIVKQHIYENKYSDSEREQIRLEYQPRLVTNRPLGFSLVSTLYGLPDETGQKITDSYIFVRDGQFTFESADQQKPQRFWRVVRDDGLPVYVCEAASELAKLVG